MSEPPKETRPHRSVAKTHAQIKAERLQAALRDNLRRRKAAMTPAKDENSGDHEKASPNES